MSVCGSCGRANDVDASFCSRCGAALAPALPATHETRKVVTVIFCDVVDSTPLAERLDPEAVRRVMSRYFDEARQVVETHGGTVEKFIGDAVMAVFGVPVLREDDALRAVRAALAIRDRVEAVNAELERTWGVRIGTRIGVNTGAVVAGDGRSRDALVTGDTVNVAKRLEEAAATGDVLIGNATRRLVAHAVEAEPVGALAVKGRQTAVETWRLLRVHDDVAALPRRFDSPLVGRDSELRRLADAFEHVRGERTCSVWTVVGPAGIGKSRLVRELVARLGDEARFLSGRCLAYGDGITFWPLAQIVRELGGEEGLSATLRSAEDGGEITDRVRGLVGLAPVSGSSEEAFWAVRRWFEELARERPLIVCFEDIHWAEPKLLDLIEYLAGWTRHAPVLIVCLARPELLDRRPGFAGAADGSRVVRLAPLSPVEADELLAHFGADALPPAARARVVAVAEGNPLFVEQMVAMARDETATAADGDLAIPPSIHALLAARLGALEPEQRAVLERASVVGKEFWRGAVAELTRPEARERVGAHLMALVRKGLVRPERSSFPREDAFGFLHVLIRDAAYEGVPKQLRAELHERLAAWLERTAGDHAGALAEIIGYHYEQAYRYREQLGLTDDRGAKLAERAGELLGAAGRRAFAREDMSAAVKLLDRAVSLVTDQDPARLELVRELSQASWAVGELARAETLLNGLIEAASAAGDRRIQWYALLDRAARQDLANPDASPDDLLSVSEEAIRVFDELGDELGLARAWRRLATVAQARGHYAMSEQAAERAIAHARRARDGQEEARSVDRLCTALLYGPSAAGQAIPRCELLLAEASGNRLLEANVASALAGLKAMRGDFNEGRAQYRRAFAIYEDLGNRLALSGLTRITGMVELLAGDPVAAEDEFRRGYDILAGMGVQAVLATDLARALHLQGRDDEAWEVSDVPDESRLRLTSRAAWLGVRARLEARRGDADKAVRCAREAVALAATTDALAMRADALMDLADVLRLAEERDGAADAVRQAIALYEAKGNRPAVWAARSAAIEAIS